jgi:predicted PurR-regulated permease PerM
MWLRDLGLLAWFLVGVGILVVGLVWLLGLTSTITVPVALGAILATVAGPLVTTLECRRIPRAAGAALVLLGMS